MFFGKFNNDIFSALLLLIMVFNAICLSFNLASSVNAETMPRAYIIHVNEKNWIASHQLVNLLLRSKIPVYWVSKSFVYDGVTYSEGDFIIPITVTPIYSAAPSSDEINNLTTFLASKLNVTLVPVTKDIEVTVYLLRPVKIAVYGGNGALPTPYIELFSTLGFLTEYIDDNDIRAGLLKNFDILVMPGDGSDSELLTLGVEGGQKVQEFIASGGGYISSCAGSWAAALGVPGWDISYNLQLINAKLWNVIEGAGTFKKLYPGIGVMIFKNTNPTHPVMWGIPETFEMVWWQGPIFEIAPNILQYASKAEGLVVQYSFTEKFTAAEYYTNLKAQMEKGFTGTTVYNALVGNKPVVVSGTYGRGKVVLFGPHPEFKTELVLNGFSCIPGRMPINAALWMSSTGPYTLSISSGSIVASTIAPLPESLTINHVKTDWLMTEAVIGLDKALSNKNLILTRLNELRGLYTSNPNPPWTKTPTSWFDGSCFGMNSTEMLKYYINKIPELCSEFEKYCNYTTTTVKTLWGTYDKLTALESEARKYESKYNVENILMEISNVKERIVHSLYLINEGINMASGPTVTYGGKEGVLYLMDKAASLMKIAVDNYMAEKTTSTTNPLRNIGTYGAAGCIVHALNTLRGRTAYANTETLYAEYIINKVGNELNSIKALENKETETSKTISGTSNLVNDILNRIKNIEASFSWLYGLVIAMGIITAILTTLTLLIISRRLTTLKLKP